MTTENYVQCSNVRAPYDYDNHDYPMKVIVEFSEYAAKKILHLIELLKKNGLEHVSAPAAEISMKWLREDETPYEYNQNIFLEGRSHTKLFRPAKTTITVLYDYHKPENKRLDVYVWEHDFGDNMCDFSTVIDLEAMSKHFGLDYNSEYENNFELK